MLMVERRITFGLEDIKGVRLRCQGCRNEIVVRADRDRDYDLKERCPLCNEEWLTRKAVEHIKGMIHDFRYLRTEKVNFSIEIEIDAPDN